MYNEAFFKLYSEYLRELTVRRNHDRAFGLWSMSMPSDPDVVDLGCGMGEFYHYGDSNQYVGIDLAPRLPQGASAIAADYTKKEWAEKLPFKPTAFVSLFSIEPVFSPATRYNYYTWLFKEFPTLQYGLTAGFYYADKYHLPSVGETGGIESFQTNTLLGSDYGSYPFNEEWLTMRTPSKMFGNEVVEVWKFLTRK